MSSRKEAWLKTVKTECEALRSQYLPNMLQTTLMERKDRLTVQQDGLALNIQSRNIVHSLEKLLAIIEDLRATEHIADQRLWRRVMNLRIEELTEEKQQLLTALHQKRAEYASQLPDMLLPYEVLRQHPLLNGSDAAASPTLDASSQSTSLKSPT